MTGHCIHAFQRRGFLLPLALALGFFLLVAALPQGVRAQARPAGAAADSAKSYKLCLKCGMANLPEARFCFSCGAAFEAGAIPAVLPESARGGTWGAGRCPVCGTGRYPESQFCSNCGAPFTDILSASAPRKIESGPKKQPVLAFASSLLIPGAGQFYNGQPGKGGLFFVGYLTGWGLFFKAVLSEDNAIGYTGLVLGGGAWLGSMIDAPVTASNLNHRRGYSTLTHPGAGLVFVPDPRNPGHAKPGVGLRAGF